MDPKQRNCTSDIGYIRNRVCRHRVLIVMLMMVVMVMAAVMAIAVASAATAAIVHGRFGRSARGQSVFFNFTVA